MKKFIQLLKLLTVLCLGLLGAQVSAQQALTEADALANAANKERLLKSGKMSPRQKAELLRAEKVEQAEANQQASASFLAANKLKAGVVTLSSGVQYRAIKTGAGVRPTQANTVRLQYQGTLADGTRFEGAGDSSSSVLQVAGLLPGLQEALTHMPVGSKWEVVVPPSLGYGTSGYRGVGPNAVLIYVIELVGIV